MLLVVFLPFVESQKHDAVILNEESGGNKGVGLHYNDLKNPLRVFTISYNKNDPEKTSKLSRSEKVGLVYM